MHDRLMAAIREPRDALAVEVEVLVVNRVVVAARVEELDVSGQIRDADLAADPRVLRRGAAVERDPVTRELDLVALRRAESRDVEARRVRRGPRDAVEAGHMR